MKEYNITMLGQSGVGKTTLLSSMYHHFAENFKNELQLKPDNEDHQQIKNRVEKLKNLTNNSDGIAPAGIDGTAEPKEFIFELGAMNKKLQWKLIFKDYPGGYLDNVEKYDQVAKDIDTSQVIIVAIDAAALMETANNISFNDKINNPTRIKQFFAKAFENLKNNKLILLVPIKCEKYFKDHSEDKLRESINSHYKESLDYLKDHCKKTVSVVMTPVQTMGNVFFKDIQIDSNSNPKFNFNIDQDKKYSPEDVDQPLLFIISFLLAQYDKTWWKDKKLKETLIDFLSKKKNNDHILQNENLMFTPPK